MINIINELELKSNKTNYFNRHKNNENNKTNNINKKKNNITKRIIPNNSSKNDKFKHSKISFSPLKNIDNNTVTFFELPKMRFSPKNDFERIKEDINKRRGKVLDDKLLKRLYKKYRAKINNKFYDFLNTNPNSCISINNLHPLNISEKIILKNLEQSNKEENEKNKIFKNKILNSKLIKNITFNEKYKYKTFYQGLTFSLINHKNNNINNMMKIKKINAALTPSQTQNNILNKRIKK